MTTLRGFGEMGHEYQTLLTTRRPASPGPPPRFSPTQNEARFLSLALVSSSSHAATFPCEYSRGSFFPGLARGSFRTLSHPGSAAEAFFRGGDNMVATPISHSQTAARGFQDGGEGGGIGGIWRGILMEIAVPDYNLAESEGDRSSRAEPENLGIRRTN